MAQKVTESVKGMDQGMETVAEVGLDRAGAEVSKGLEGSAFKSPCQWREVRFGEG